MIRRTIVLCVLLAANASLYAQDWWKPYSAPCTEREDVFSFKQKPSVKLVGKDRYEISFTVEGFCDVTVGLIDEKGVVVRHVASGVLGKNAPAPFQKDSLEQKIHWNGKTDLGTYVKEPEKLKVKVSLGLKPVFDKRLGGASPYNIPAVGAWPGGLWGIAADPDGVYVMSLGRRFYVRRFDHDGKYVRSLLPPPADLPEAKLEGRGYIEYEPGKRDPHARYLDATTANVGSYLSYGGYMINYLQPTVTKGRLYYFDNDLRLYRIGTDGSTDRRGAFGRPFIPGRSAGGRSGFGHLAASPDGKWLYFTDNGGSPCVWRCAPDGDKPAEVFIAGKVGGEGRKRGSIPGNGPGEFNTPRGIACDGQGRLYVCDRANNRLQIFSPDGKFLKQVRMDRPALVQVHGKTGAIYVHHTVRVEGKSLGRVTRLSSFDNPAVEAHVDHPAECMALDWWAKTPRVWLARGGYSVTVWEDKGKSFEKIVDFDEETKKEAGKNHFGRWPGHHSNVEKIAADPVREQAYYCNTHRFDLRTGDYLGVVKLGGPDDIAVDKRGYMHMHFRPMSPPLGISRVDPDHGYSEVPYDYGVEAKKWAGVLPCRDQLGAKFFQDGIGVNMMGDVAENCNIYYAPKMDDEAKQFSLAGVKDMAVFGSFDDDGNNYSAFVAQIAERKKRGEEVYSIRRRPGVSLIGATIWTFNRSGEVRDECAVTAGQLINGVQLDEDGHIYFVNNRTRLMDGAAFLAGHGGVFGVKDDKKNTNPFTGTLMKVNPQAKVLTKRAPVPLEEEPKRPHDVTHYGRNAWVEGAEWLYAGASPIVPGGCSCPTMRFQTDWYKRTFVPEVYRHSIGVLDSAGNLIMHLGRYGNFDSGADLGMAFVNVVAATDNYLCYPDHGEKLVVLKLEYHAEETVPVSVRQGN